MASHCNSQSTIWIAFALIPKIYDDDWSLTTASFELPSSYQYAVILLIYALPLLVMLVTYSLVGRSLWGGHIPGEATDHYHNQIAAKRKVTMRHSTISSEIAQMMFNRNLLASSAAVAWIGVVMCQRWWRWWSLWWWPLPSAGCRTTSTSSWGRSTETFINKTIFSRWAAVRQHLLSFSGFFLCVFLHWMTGFSASTGVFGYFLAGHELYHVQPHNLLLSEPKVRDNSTHSNASSSQTCQKKEKNPLLPAGSALVSATPSPGAPSSRCQRRTRWSCSTRTPSESPCRAATAGTALTLTTAGRQPLATQRPPSARRWSGRETPARLRGRTALPSWSTTPTDSHWRGLGGGRVHPLLQRTSQDQSRRRQENSRQREPHRSQQAFPQT